MSFTYKIILDTRRPKLNDTYPLKIRVYNNGRFRELSLNIKARKADWDSNSETLNKGTNNYTELSYKLTQAKSKIERIILLSEEKGIYSLDQLLQEFNGNRIKKTTPYLQKYGNELIEELNAAKRVGTAMAYEQAISSIVSYAGKGILITNIDYTLLVKYEHHMLARGIKINTIGAYLRSIRAIYNRSIKDKLVNSTSYPFNEYTIKRETTGSRRLSVSDMRTIAHCDLPINTPIWHAKNLFMLSFYLIGMNYSDLLILRTSNIENDILSYRRSKTKKLYKLTLPAPAIEIINYYLSFPSHNDHYYILPFLNYSDDIVWRKKRVKQICKNNNTQLSEISRKFLGGIKLTTYYARYTWSNIAKDLGYSNDIIAEALGHEYGNKVTHIYLDKYDREAIDKVNSHVIDTVAQ